MPIDPKYMKLKARGGRELTNVQVPKRLVDLLQAHGVNMSEVCRSALDEALATSTMPPKAEELKAVAFRYDSAKLRALDAYKINRSEVIRNKLRELEAQLTITNKRARK